MEAVEEIGLEIMGNLCRLADAGNEHNVLRLDIKLRERKL